MTQKKLYLIVISALTLIIAVILFSVTFHINTSSISKEKLASEISVLEKSSSELKSEKEQLEQQISDIDTELSTKTTINNYYMEYKKTYDALTSEISDLKNQSAQLDTEINEKKKELNDNSSVKEEKKGKSYTMKKDEIFTCPDKLPAGRYIVSGKGTFTITSSAGKVRVTQNLDVATDNSYTFNISEKEQIRSTGDVTVTELK